jgi:hypothetical protein
MLHEFIQTHRADLIVRCRTKVADRSAPPATADELQYGVPLILDQLVEALSRESALPSPHGDSAAGFSPQAPGWKEATRTAGLHGAELLKLGYTVDQVVHDYGDICQAVTELAGETDSKISVENFHTFNRFLDNAIAGAVTSFGESQRAKTNDSAQELKIQVEIANTTFEAIKVGNVGVRGATGSLLEKSLLKLRSLTGS